MKSYFLDHVSSLAEVEAALRSELPGQEHPWLILISPGDPMAYVRVSKEFEDGKNLRIQVDISGRHYDQDQVVLQLLQRLQMRVGGTISSDA